MLCCGQKTRKNWKTESDIKRTLKLSTQSKAGQQSKQESGGVDSERSKDNRHKQVKEDSSLFRVNSMKKGHVKQKIPIQSALQMHLGKHQRTGFCRYKHVQKA